MKITNNESRTLMSRLRLVGAMAAAFSAMAPLAAAADTLVLTSTNATQNNIVVFKLNTSGTPSLSLESMVPTGGAGGASGNAGALQFPYSVGAVVNYGSNTVSELIRTGDSISVNRTIKLASGCVNPLSVALELGLSQVLVAGTNCAESHNFESGALTGPVVTLPDNSAGQIAAGQTWAAVTMKSGSVVKLPLTAGGWLSGTSSTISLPADANNTPLGAAFWGNLLAFEPAHSPDSFVLVNSSQQIFPVVGPQPSFPTNAPCWLAKGPGNIWYTGNSPGAAVSIFFSDGQGGTFYKSVSVPGTPTDITVSADNQWLAVIYTAADGSGGRIAVFAIDAFGDLTLTATSSPIGVPSFNGVAISQ